MTSTGFWAGRRVLVTGHTGFKGAWLALWLIERGARVCGLALPPESPLSLYQQLDLGRRMHSVFADINDAAQLSAVMQQERPDVVFHLAAQALVRRSYGEPVETFATNVLGTVQLLQAVRNSEVRAVVVVTSDKAYENREWPWGYREADQLGGHDPYSASKAAAELAVGAMRRSYFAPYRQDGHPARIATVRAGNVIGGGDWAAERLVPDVVRSCLLEEETVTLRNPASIRPWQHVLDPLAFYMELAERLVSAPEQIDAAWNIGPDPGEGHTVLEVAQAMVRALGRGRLAAEAGAKGPHEAGMLALDCAMARQVFGWRPCWPFGEAIRYTADWYAAWHAGGDPVAISTAQIAAFETCAANLRNGATAGREY